MAGEVPAGVAALTRGVLTTMTIQKLKAMATAAVALGLIGASFGRGQAIGPAPGADRMEAVERKLDRLLEAIGDRRVGWAPAATGAAPTRGTPEIGPPASPRATAPQATRRRPGPETSTNRSGDVYASETGRLDRLERLVDEVQGRLDDQERRLQALERADGHGGPGATPKIPVPGGGSS